MMYGKVKTLENMTCSKENPNLISKLQAQAVQAVKDYSGGYSLLSDEDIFVSARSVPSTTFRIKIQNLTEE